MDTYQDDEEIVMVPVPKSQLRAVYAALAAPTLGRGAPAPAEEEVEVYKQGRWTATMVNQLEAGLENPAMRTLITRLAEQAPRELPFKDAVAVTGMQANLLKAQFGSLSKISKRLFQRPRPTWPMSVRYGDEAIYRMDPKVADWWLKAIGRRP